jgi:hypothetical protein
MLKSTVIINSGPPLTIRNLTRGGGGGGSGMMVFHYHPLDRCHPHIPADPPPKKNLLPPQGGSGIPPIPKKPPFSFFAYFRLFSMSSSEAIFGKMKTNFKKPREVFLHNGMKNKKISHFFHRYHEQGESKPSSRPFFPDFHFFVTVLILRELLRPAGGEFGETEGGFCPEHAHIQ